MACRRWILPAGWSIIALFIVLEHRSMNRYIAMLADSGALDTHDLPLVRPAPANYADTHTWVRLALSLGEENGWRVRHTNMDNAPQGRDVHWSSLFANVVALAGRVERARTGLPLPRATEQAASWFNIPLFLVTTIALSWWAASQLGTGAAAMLAFGMVGHESYSAGFAAGYIDHHGLLSAAILGLVLGAVFMEAGRARSARRAATLSALAGGLGMWLSAASTWPTIAFVGIGGIAASVMVGSGRDGARFRPDIWRHWGRVGAATCLAAWLLEYAPAHLGMRLETNHPLYALAWLGGAELVALVGTWRQDGDRPAVARLLLVGGALGTIPALIAWKGAGVFLPVEPRLRALHGRILEFLSVPALVAMQGWGGIWKLLPAFLLTLLAVGVLIFRRQNPEYRWFVLVGTTVLAGAMLGMYENRWWLTGSGAQLVLLVVTLRALANRTTTAVRTIGAVSLSVLCLVPSGIRIATNQRMVRDRVANEEDALQPLYRDMAAAIRATDSATGGGADVVLLGSPDVSTGVGYFGQFETLGTLYWENLDGLAAAATVLYAPTDEEAHRLLTLRGVTHIALLVGGKDGGFEVLSAFRPPLSSSAAEGRSTFGSRLGSWDSLPRWIRPIPFRRRDVGNMPKVRLLQIVPDQSDVEARWHAAMARTAAGGDQLDAAEDGFRRVAAASGADEGKLLQLAAQHAAFWREDALAVRLYLSALALHPTPDAVLGAAWLLSTSTDDRARNGAEALALLNLLDGGASTTPGVLDVMGAALAESGRFAAAVSAAERALAGFSALGRLDMVTRVRARLATYRRGLPWRQ